MSNRKLKTMLSSELFGFGSENGVSVSSEKNTNGATAVRQMAMH
jgi:hypothetical protein